jgi:hypothetical protein
LLGLFDPEAGGDISAKRPLTINGLHGVISHKIVYSSECQVREEDLYLENRQQVGNILPYYTASHEGREESSRPSTCDTEICLLAD